MRNSNNYLVALPLHLLTLEVNDEHPSLRYTIVDKDGSEMSFATEAEWESKLEEMKETDEVYYVEIDLKRWDKEEWENIYYLKF